MTQALILPTLSQSELDALPRDKSGFADVTGYDLSGLDLSERTFSKVVFSANNSASRRTLEGTTFKDCVFLDCRFAGAVVSQATFRGARFRYCDFRYATFRNTTFTEAMLEGCDLYRTVFEGNNVFERALLRACSLHLAGLGGADIRRENLDGAVIQQHPAEYRRFQEHFKHLPVAKIGPVVALALREAAGVYRALSGLWAARGFLGDSTWAYVQSRRLERKCRYPLFVWRAVRTEAQLREEPPPSTRQRLLATMASSIGYLGLLVTDLTSAFGSSLARVLATMVVVVVAFALTYQGLGAIVLSAPTEHASATFFDCLAFSVGKMMAASPERIRIAGKYEFVAAAQTFVGLGLIGLFGFVLGNRVRQS